MRTIAKALSVLMIGLMPVAGYAADATPAAAPATTPIPAFTDAQKAAIEDIVRDLLTKKEPDIVMKAAQEMQKKTDAENATKSAAALTTSHDAIFNDPNSPVTGNPKGDVVIAEFFDYQCGFCKMAKESVDKLVAQDKNIKFVWKEFPILGPNSVTATKAALASVKQGKYDQFHDALLGLKDHLSDDLIYKTAKDSGLDVEKLKADMAGDDISKMVAANLALGNEIGAHGTPTFVIGDQLYPGAMQLDQMKTLVDTARKNEKK